MNPLAIVVAGIAAVVLSTLYYMLFGRAMSSLHPAYADPNARPAPRQVATEVLRSIVLAFVIAALVRLTHIEGVQGAVHLAALLWIGFPLVLWAGAVTWERVPLKLAAIHAGDWLLKLLVVTTIVTVWR